MTDPDDLLRRLTDDAPEARLRAVLEAAAPDDGAAPPALVEALVRRLDDAHPGVIQAALETLVRLIEAGRAQVGPDALARAIALASHASPLVRAEAVGALGVFCPGTPSPDRAARLLAALEDPEAEVRRTAAAAAGDLRLDAAKAPLAAKLDDPAVRFEAAFALASLRDSRARSVLEAALDARSSRLDALEGLRRLEDPAAAPAVRALVKGWLTPWVDRLSAWATLHVLGDPDAGAALVERASSRRMEERVYALFLLGRYRIDAGRARVAQVADAPADPQRETALDALGLYGDAEAVRQLGRIAEDPAQSPDARITAARALTRCADGAASLARLRRDPDPAIRAAATTGGG